ncbi:MAG: efflux RND transporter permease subunit, partial [Rhodobacterales bacterium]|nr:efflux RND transporter permease subunit [Rhodobacterales bacterium]
MTDRKHPLGIAGSLTKAFINSALTPLFILAALAAGVVALVSLPREEEPQISVPLVDIHIQAQGLRAADAVKLVTEPLEVIVKGINDVEHVYSQTRDDAAMVTARFEVGTRSEDAILRVHDKVRANIDRLPVGIPEPLIVGRGIDDVAILTLTLSSENLSANDLTRIARTLQTEVAKTDDVGLTYLVGDAQDAIRIEPDPDRLALYGVTLQQLAGKVAQANRTLNTGKLRDQGEMIDLVAGETLTAPAEVANLLLTTRDGRPVYVSDVARVAYVPNTNQTIVASLTRAEDGSTTGGPAVTLAIAKRAGANAVVVAEEVLHRVEALKPKLIPDDVTITITR